MSSGSIYVVGVEGEASVKIGSTTSSVEKRRQQCQFAEKRRRGLRRSDPFQLTILATVTVEVDLRRIEHTIHTILADHRCHGEWFDVLVDQMILEDLVKKSFQMRDKITMADRWFTTKSRALGQCIAQLRQEHDISRSMLAFQAMVPLDSLKRIEGGHSSIDHLSIGTVRRIATVLGVTMDYLIGVYDGGDSR